MIATREGASNVVSVLSAIYGGKEIKYAFREGKDPSFIVDGDSYQTARVTVIPEYKASYMETSREKFLQETQDSEKNWRLADQKGLSPELYFYGYIRQGNNLNLNYSGVLTLYMAFAEHPFAGTSDINPITAH